MKIIDAIINNPKESRKRWLLDIFAKNGLQSNNNLHYQFWQVENHLILLDNDAERYSQRMQYMHENPVRAGFVMLLEEWKYSSAIDFYTNREGLITLTE